MHMCVSFSAVWRLHRKKPHTNNSHCDVTLNLNINVCIHSRSTPLYEVLCIYVKRMRLFVLENILFLCDWLMIACLVCCVHGTRVWCVSRATLHTHQNKVFGVCLIYEYTSTVIYKGREVNRVKCIWYDFVKYFLYGFYINEPPCAGVEARAT